VREEQPFALVMKHHDPPVAFSSYSFQLTVIAR
jgi:hypothetical protein